MRYDGDTQTQYACHNCRRRHLRCDRALPQCLKCINRGRQCLGYEEQFRWENGLSRHGKMDRVKFQDMERGDVHLTGTKSSIPPLTATLHADLLSNPDVRILCDPVYQDLNDRSRVYLSYCTRWHLSFALSTDFTKISVSRERGVQRSGHV